MEGWKVRTVHWDQQRKVNPEYHILMNNLLELEIPSRKRDRFNYRCYDKKAKALNGIRTLKPSKKRGHRPKPPLSTRLVYRKVKLNIIMYKGAG